MDHTSSLDTTTIEVTTLEIDDVADICSPLLCQSHATRIGGLFAETCIEILRGQGWVTCNNLMIPDIGVEIDQLAYTRKNTRIYFEFKGSYAGQNPGLRRAASVKTVVANAFLLSQHEEVPYIIMTSHLPREMSTGNIMLKRINGLLKDIICIYEQDDIRRLKWILENL